MENQKEKKALFDKAIEALKSLKGLFFNEDAEPCEGCNKTEEEQLGANISSLLESKIAEITEAEGATTSRADIIGAIASETNRDENTINQIIAGGIDCPPEDVARAIARALSNLTWAEFMEAWAADGCEPLEEEDDMKTEEPVAEAEALNAIIDKMKTELTAELNNTEALSNTISEQKEMIEKLQAQNSEQEALIAELKKTPAAAPIVTDVTEKKEAVSADLSTVPFWKKAVQGLDNIKRE